jgi:DNA polymerase-1
MLSRESDKKLFLIDAYALIFRAYYAFIKNPRINSKGFNTSAVFGFTNSLLEIIRVEKPTHLAVVFDPPGGSFRKEVYPEYKANRDATPEDIIASVPLIHKVLEGLQIPARVEAGFEADDLIGCLAKKAEVQGYDVYMMTPDKDFAQLVTDRVRMYRPGRGKNPAEIWGPEEVCERFSLNKTEQVIDYLGLMGDASDNIPGVPGVGAKTASKLLCEYESIEGLYKNTDKLKGKLKEKVEENHDKALLSKRLATIVVDIDTEINIEGMSRKEIDPDALREVLEELEFRTLLRKLIPEVAAPTIKAEEPRVSLPQIDEKNSEDTDGQLDMFSVASTPEPVSAPEPVIRVSLGKYEIANDTSKRSELIERLKKVSSFGFHAITSGFDAMRDELVGMAFSTEDSKATYVPIEAGVLDEFKEILEDGSKEIVATNYKFAAKVLAMAGVSISKNVFDCMVAHYLIDPDSNHRLEQMADTYLGLKAYSLETLLGKGKKRKTFKDLELEVVCDYAGESADLVLRLKKVLTVEIEAQEMTKLLYEVEFPLIGVLVDIELAGVNLNTTMLEKYAVDLSGQIEILRDKILSSSGVDFNVDSPKQLGAVLFETLAITDKAKKTKTGQYSTGEDVLKKLLDAHPIVGQVLEYRKLRKLLSTYVEPLPKMVHEGTQRLHTSYMQTVASTGRLSSKDPNLQNIPVRTEAGREIRKAFIPADDDHVLLAADYSQVELRVAAAMSQDPGLCDAFKRGLDIHAATAAKVFGVKLDEVDRTQRSQAKAVNFGILYGQGAFGLAEELGIKRGEAKEIIASYNEQFSTLGDFTKACVAKARENEYAETILGRRRRLPDINSNNGMVKAFAERNAVNAPIQGSAADIIKIAMVKIAEAIRTGNLKARMIMQVHDELVFDVPKGELEILKPLVKDCMENAVELSVPLDVDMSSGADWLEAH